MKKSMQKVLFWFRQDLRLQDNPGLNMAIQAGAVAPIYILDQETPGKLKMGQASLWWLHHSLHSLNESCGMNLSLYKGNALDIIPKLIEQEGFKKVFFNRCYEPWRQTQDSLLTAKLKQLGVYVETTNASLLWEPWEVNKEDGTPYKVFTPFFKSGCLNKMPPRQPEELGENARFIKLNSSDRIDSLGLIPKKDWHKTLEKHWNIGELGAQKRFATFLKEGFENYKEGRNFPIEKNVSRLSPYLHHGEISPHTVWYGAKHYAKKNNIPTKDSDHFLSELGWREFSHNLLHNFQDLPEKNFQSKFDNFPWQNDQNFLKAWQKGQTGIPIVDAGMRQLWQTGYMHNRLRMIVGSFLVKNLLIDWRYGWQWFWDCLNDAGLANNSASWQWIAGSGADAAPYFRIFNPILQGEKFDKDGEFTRRYVPELKNLPNNYLFKPWEASADVLRKANVKLGENYPAPIVDLKDSRDAALKAFEKTK